MRDDDTFDDVQSATPPADRSGDVPSSERTPDPRNDPRDPAARGAERLATGLADLGARSRRQLTGLWAGNSPLRLRTALGNRDPRRTVLAGVVCCLGLATFAQASGDLTGGHSAATVAAASQVVARADEQAASRSMDRAAKPADPAATAGAQRRPAATSTPADPDTSTGPATHDAPTKIEDRVDPGPVAGLSEAQMDNAKAIVRTGRDMGVPRRGLIIAVATAMQESNLLNLASGVLPESMNHPNQGVGWDHDSVGLFQQRSSSGWGPVGRLMDPAFATAQFLTALRQVPGWQRMSLAQAAQTVQVSAFPYAYAQHESQATTVVNAIVPGWS